MLVAILNDTHFGAKNSSNTFIKYQEDFYNEIFFPYLKKHKIQRILHLGDYAEHRKFINIKALESNKKHFLDRLVTDGITMDIIPGNHDVYYKSSNALCSLDLIFHGYEDNVNLFHEPVHLDYDGFKIAFIPWISPENKERIMKFVKASKAPLCAGHFEFTGFELYPGILAQTGMSITDFAHFNKVISGHYHTKSQNSNVEYLGAQMEFTWGDCDDPKYFHILDTETGEIEPILNELRLYQRMTYDDVIYDYKDFDFTVFDNKFVQVVVQQKKDPYLFDVFLDNINRRPIHDLKISESFSEFSGKGVESEIKFEETVDLMDKYIDEVSTPLNKDAIKLKLKELYTEAQMVEYD